MVEYFDPFGLIMPHEIHHYLATSGKKVIWKKVIKPLKDKKTESVSSAFDLIFKKSKRKPEKL